MAYYECDSCIILPSMVPHQRLGPPEALSALMDALYSTAVVALNPRLEDV